MGGGHIVVVDEVSLVVNPAAQRRERLRRPQEHQQQRRRRRWPYAIGVARNVTTVPPPTSNYLVHTESSSKLDHAWALFRREVRVVDSKTKGVGETLVGEWGGGSPVLAAVQRTVHDATCANVTRQARRRGARLSSRKPRYLRSGQKNGRRAADAGDRARVRPRPWEPGRPRPRTSPFPAYGGRCRVAKAVGTNLRPTPMWRGRIRRLR